MSNEKKPQSGEWWRLIDESIVRVAGIGLGGFVVVDAANGLLERRTLAAFKRHLPDCTGFNWVEPPRNNLQPQSTRRKGSDG